MSVGYVYVCKLIPLNHNTKKNQDFYNLRNSMHKYEMWNMIFFAYMYIIQ